jgi:hypothetical protein
MRFLLIVGAKFDLRSCCCRDRGGQIVTSHVLRSRESWQSPKVCWALVPWGIEIGSHCRAKDWVNWRKCGKFGTEQESLGWNVAHTKNARANRVKLCKRTTRKLRATKNVFKVERCGSSLLTSNRKLNLEKNCWFLNEIASKKCCESCSQWSVHCKT